MSSRGSKKLKQRIATGKQIVSSIHQKYELAIIERNIFMALLIDIIQQQPNKSIELQGSPEDVLKRHTGIHVLNSNFNPETKVMLLSTSDKVVVAEKSANTNPETASS